jgi:hypothetical protein
MIVGVALLALGDVRAQGPAAIVAPRPGAADTPVARCSAANRQSLADLVQAFEAAQKRSRLNPVTVARLQAFDVQLGSLRAAQPRDGRSLRECEHLTQLIAAEQERLQRIAPDPRAANADAAASAPATDACRSANVEAYGEAARVWRERAAARGLKVGQAEYDDAQLRLRRLRDEVAKSGGTLRECETLAQAIAQERVRAQPAGATAAASAPQRAATTASAPLRAAIATSAPATAPAAPPAPAACMAAAAEAYNELVRSFNELRGSVATRPALAVPLQATAERLNTLYTVLSAPTPAGPPCAQLTQTIAAEQRQLQGLAAGVGPVAKPP